MEKKGESVIDKQSNFYSCIFSSQESDQNLYTKLDGANKQPGSKDKQDTQKQADDPEKPKTGKPPSISSKDNTSNATTLLNKNKVYEDKIYTVGKTSQGDTLIRCYNAEQDSEVELKQEPQFEGNIFTDIVELKYDPVKHKPDFDPDFDTLGVNKITNLAVALNNGRLFFYGL